MLSIQERRELRKLSSSTRIKLMRALKRRSGRSPLDEETRQILEDFDSALDKVVFQLVDRRKLPKELDQKLQELIDLVSDMMKP